MAEQDLLSQVVHDGHQSHPERKNQACYTMFASPFHPPVMGLGGKSHPSWRGTISLGLLQVPGGFWMLL